MATISLKNIGKHFGSTSIIDDLNLEIADGEFIVLVGASGCGKSTTLRMIAGLESTSEGQIFIGDRDVTELGPGKRNCAMVFQNYALYPHMTVAENIGFGLRLRGMSKSDIETTVKRAADTLGLTPQLDRYPKALSGGQRQRVAIGRAIVRQPDVFLFDEPLSNLDAKLRIEMRTEIKELHSRLGTTIVYVTHDQVEAMTMADRVVVMDKGKIIQASTPLELYERPVNTFVAGFIGAPSMNFLAGTVVKQNESTSLRLADDKSIMLPKSYAVQDKDELILGLRPEHISRGNGDVSMTVRSVEPLGSHTLAIGLVGTSPVTVELEARDPVRAGERLPLKFDLSKSHLFKSGSGQRIQL
jgi:multiple sugar transport system ATP-binding protein